MTHGPTRQPSRAALLAAPAIVAAAVLAPAATATAAPPPPPLLQLVVDLPGVLDVSISLGAGPGSTANVNLDIPIIQLDLVKVNASRLLGIPGLEALAPSLTLNSDANLGTDV